MRKSTLGLACTLAVFSGATFATRYTLNYQDGSGVMAAVQSGDLSKIDQLLHDPSNKPNVVDLVTAARFRVLGDVDQSTQFAEKCYAPDQLGQSRSAPMLCGLLVAGNALRDGDVAKWATLSEDMKSRAMPSLTKMFNDGLQRLAAKDTTKKFPPATPDTLTVDVLAIVHDYTPFRNWPYRESVSSNGSPAHVPVEWVATATAKAGKKPPALPFVTINVNGQPIKASVDTGSSSALMLSEADAARLGITHITAGWLTVVHIGYPTGSSLGNAGSVVIGNVTFKNVPVVVTGTGNFPVIGLNLLRQLGRVDFSKDVLDINPPANPACSTPMTMASIISSDQSQLFFPIEVDGQPARALIDTGAETHFYGMSKNFTALANAPGAQLKVMNVQIFSQLQSVPYVLQTSELSIDGEKHQVHYSVLDGKNVNYDYAIGAEMLWSHDIQMDFKNGLLCLNHRA
jgi:hypothetical protein